MAADKIIVGMPLGRWQTNCYLVGDRSTASCVVIDPGEEGEHRVPALLRQTGLTCDAILVTHGHLDHFWAAPALARALDVAVLMHPGDRWLWDDPAAGFGVGLTQAQRAGMLDQLGMEWLPPTDQLEEVRDGQTLDLGGGRFTVRHSPGHTPGHVTFLGHGLAGAALQFALGAPAASADVLFSGDLVFAGSVGRTDFPRSSAADLLRALVDTVLPLEDDTVILSGHGPDTTVGRERATNPFVAEARTHVG